MDDRDLDLLRSFRLDEAEPDRAALDRIHDDVWQAVLAEERARAGHRPVRHRAAWWQGLLRPAVAAGVAASLAAFVAFTSDGGVGVRGTSDATVRQASTGVLDSTARSLFGSDAVSTSPLAGSIDLRDASDTDLALAAGPQHAPDGSLDEATAALARTVTRDPARLRDSLRSAAVEEAGADAGDRRAFRAAMRWVVDPAAPTDLRASMLRALGQLDGLDPALPGVDMLGRPGIVVGHLDASTGIRSQYLLDQEQGRLLEQRAFTTAYVDPACPAGTFTEHELYDDAGTRVEEARAQWLDWPLVVGACDPAN